MSVLCAWSKKKPRTLKDPSAYQIEFSNTYTDGELHASILHEVGHIGQPTTMPAPEAELQASTRALDMAVKLKDKILVVEIKNHIRAYRHAPAEYAYVYKQCLKKGII